jgi:hypothetical protein
VAAGWSRCCRAEPGSILADPVRERGDPCRASISSRKTPAPRSARASPPGSGSSPTEPSQPLVRTGVPFLRPSASLAVTSPGRAHPRYPPNCDHPLGQPAGRLAVRAAVVRPDSPRVAARPGRVARHLPRPVMSRRGRPGRSPAGPCSRPAPGRPQQPGQVRRRVTWPGLQQVGQPFLAAGVQDLADRRGGAAEAELDRVAGNPARVCRQAVQVRGGLARVGQRRPHQPGDRRGRKRRRRARRTPRRAAGSRAHRAAGGRARCRGQSWR